MPSMKLTCCQAKVAAKQVRIALCATSRKEEVEDRARELGGAYGSLDEFIRDQLPVSSQPGQRRRKKEWNPAKRKPHKREKVLGKLEGPALSHSELLHVARPALAAAAKDLGIEFVGVVLSRPPRGPTPSAFKCWIDCEGGVMASALTEASAALRDALWGAIPGRPAITVMTPGPARPLFSLADFERHCGLRAQVTFREVVDGRRRLVGELIGTETDDADEYALVLDESAGKTLRAPLSTMLFGERTGLLPLDVPSRSSPLTKHSGGGKAKEAGAFVDAVLASAPVVVFANSMQCSFCQRALRVLQESGCCIGDSRMRLVVIEGRADMAAIQKDLRRRTGGGSLPRVFMSGVARTAGGGWVGGTEDLEALVAAGPGRVHARLQEASWALSMDVEDPRPPRPLGMDDDRQD
eukprot:CAMPEP_0119303902 /NCGR_PEP_ID=MMETSP1333-20130426/5256_1 /TAXON_ID=418940 /ORGANISM="Scyphosphaera apsteinii, Strain RCC1455" /LENGTH=409 /DNA_ID=CAMNT_0007306681 /DNA_START=130 /DNA_END=1360 /DNA_ORIENTATION=-